MFMSFVYYILLLLKSHFDYNTRTDKIKFLKYTKKCLYSKLFRVIIQ